MIKPKYLLFIVISLIINDAFSNISSGREASLGKATYIVTLLNYIALFILMSVSFKSKLENHVPNSIKNLYKLWILWLLGNLIRSAFIATDYWDWKLLFLDAFFFSLVPLAFYIGENLEIAQAFFKYFFKYLFTYGFLLIPIGFATNPELYPRLMIPISLFILFIPYIKFKWKALIIIVMITSIILVLGFRSNIAKSGFSLLLLLCFYYKSYIKQGLLLFSNLLLFAIPIVLLVLAVFYNYNVFEEMEKKDSATVEDAAGEMSFTTDTRTFLYVEVFSSIDYTHEWYIGKSSIGSYRSDWFYDTGGAMKGKRYGSEVGILNIFLKYGIIGVLIYFFLLLTVSWNAIKNSSNILSKMIGLFIAFRFFYSFIEEYTNYDLNFYFFWIAVGMVSSNKFRNMTDEEIKTFFNDNELQNSRPYYLS